MAITQRAVIVKIESGLLYLEMCRPESCAGCKAQAACSSIGSGKEAILHEDGVERKVGDEVTLSIKRSQGVQAVMFAYLLPVAIAIGILIGLQRAGVNEGATAGIALGAIALYFIVLRIFRKKLESELTITIL